MDVLLAYGRSGLKVKFPAGRSTVIEPKHLPGLENEAEELRRAMRRPLQTAPLRELVRPDQSVAISVCDITRPMPSARVLPVLLQELAHLPTGRITVLVATGSHRPNTEAELEQMLGAEVMSKCRVVNHKAQEKEELEWVGRTAAGIPVWINRRWMESDFRITTGFVEPHFFAGFSGGPKMVAPGLAGLDTIMHLHSAPLIAHEQATWGVTQGNPIHDAIREIARMCRVDFSLDVAINREHAITAVFAGELATSHPRACDFVGRTAMQPVEEAFDLVVTTNSGYPLDLNLYQAVKGMSAAARVIRPGGTIFCAAECSDGIPEHGRYHEILRSGRSPQDLLDRILSPGYSCQDQWQVQIQAQIQLKAQVRVKAGRLTAEQIRSAHLEPVEDLQAALDGELDRLGPSAKVCVLPQGPQTIPYLLPS